RVPVRVPQPVRRWRTSRSGEPIARVDRRTKNLTKRLQPGEIAVIDHEDIDRVSADALVACRPVCVINASRSMSGRYPNQGPELILAAGIPIIDHVGPQIMTVVQEGTELRVEGSEIFVGDDQVARGELLDL